MTVVAAMVQIPDSIRPIVTMWVRVHFWILAALAPLVLLPTLFVAKAGMVGKIEAQRGKIKGAMDSLKGITGQSPHPNEKWAKEISKRARQIDEETEQVWESLWEVQKPIRQWPDLGADFVARATSLKPGGTLPRFLLERYQNDIRSVVRKLPARMHADELMPEDAGGEGAAVGGQPSPPVRGPVAVGPDGRQKDDSSSLLQWNPADQQRLYESFNWKATPSTTQVKLAQEELWMYGVLCDVIAKVNSSGSNPANIPIPMVDQLQVGYPAAEDDPGGQKRSRIMRVAAGAGGIDGGMAPDAMLGVADPASTGAIRPPHPRFGGAPGAGGMPAAPPEPGMNASDGGAADDALKSWVYVDLDGKPLTAADLEAAPYARLIRLMPFVLSITIDQRALDSLLVELASAPVPIDTRQVRINAGGQPGAAGGNAQRVHDVRVELRGTLAIVMPPDPAVIGLAEADNLATGEQGE